MLLRLTAAVLGASMAFDGTASAESAAPTITQLRLPQRGASVDAVVRVAASGGISVERETLAALGLPTPEQMQEAWIPLSAIDGLTVTSDPEDAAYILTCTQACFAVQQLTLRGREEEPPLTTGAGIYLNYDAEALWLDGDQVIAGVGELNAFGRWGSVQTSWTAASGGASPGLVRLESRWTMDDRDRRLRLRLGDSVAVDASGVPFRFGGVQVGNAFELTPDFITFPTPVLAGTADAASTVELYVDGALRARENVAAGPFQIDDAPVVNGAGQAQLILTDVLGRQQILAQPFLVSTALLRPGLSDWRISAGALREAYGRESFGYDAGFVTGEYRRGLTRALTAAVAADASGDSVHVRIGMDFLVGAIGQVRLAHVQGQEGASEEGSWTYDAHSWSVSTQWQHQDSDFHGIADARPIRESGAINLSVDFGDAGFASLTVASVDNGEDPRASTASFDYSPDIRAGALSFRVLYTARERSDLSLGVSFSTQLRGEVTSSVRYDGGRLGDTYRASFSRAPEPQGGLGWRASATAGAQSLDAFALTLRGRLGEMTAEVQSANGVTGVRASQTGSIGWIAGHTFAGPRIDGAFALVDAGAPDVAIFRNGLQVGRSDGNGLALAVNLQPYAANAIAIAADDLPIDRAPASVATSVAPPEGAGAIVRFEQAARSAVETHVAYDTGAAAPRGAVLVRVRDGARFPVGSNGRAVLIGPRPGDVVELDIDAKCEAAADPTAARSGLIFHCPPAA